jgi:hypothetical protein
MSNTTATKIPERIAKPSGRAKTQAIPARPTQKRGLQDSDEEDEEEDLDPVMLLGQADIDEDLPDAGTQLELGPNEPLETHEINLPHIYNILRDNFTDQRLQIQRLENQISSLQTQHSSDLANLNSVHQQTTKALRDQIGQLTTTVGKLTARLDKIQAFSLRPTPTIQPAPPRDATTVNPKINTTINKTPHTANTQSKPSNNTNASTTNRTTSTKNQTTHPTDSSEWKTVEPKKTTFKPRYPIAEQKVVCQLGPDSPLDKSPEGTADYIKRANKIINNLTKEPGMNFGRAYITEKNNLVFQTSIHTRGMDFQPYFEHLKNEFKELFITSIDGETRWTKFLLHGVPIWASMSDLALSIQENYPGMILGQTPRWLTTEKQREEPHKPTSTAVIALIGQHTLETLETRTLIVCNATCRLAAYLPYGPASQCGNCYKLGHPTGVCKEESTCGVCGKQDHTTKLYTCPADECRQGGGCLHPPAYCVNCDSGLHRSVDPSCPAKTVARLQSKHQLGNASMEFDTDV